jgi:mono/diheme cytochrome c family protein
LNYKTLAPGKFFICLAILILLLVALLLAACKKDAQEEESPSVEAGRLIFQQNCMGCHTLSGAVKVGPGLGRLFEREKLVNGQTFSREALEQLIRQGSDGGRMPGTRLSDEELEQLILYLEQATQ